MKKKRRDYSKIRYDDIPEKIEPERIRINSHVIIDYKVFKKSPQERKMIKWAKSQLKNK